MMLESALGWYQGRISLYDKQSWETTVEQRILQGLSYTPRKTTKLKTELIDVDLVRGSTFPKAKPQSGIWLAGLHGVTRLIFLPLYGRWWIRETSCSGFLTVLFLYISVIFSAIVMFSCRHDESILKNIPASEVYLPGIALLLLSVIHSQIVCTRNSGILSSPNHKSRQLGMRQRRVRSLRKSSSVSGRGSDSQPIPSSPTQEHIKRKGIHKFETKLRFNGSRRPDLERSFAGRCRVCNNVQATLKSRQHSGMSKKHLTVMKNRPPRKMFRSHSEEPKQEEEYMLQPRSSSENNVSPVGSRQKPNIIIIKPTNEQSKVDEGWSSSTHTSSSEKSPVVGQINSRIDQCQLFNLQYERIDNHKNNTSVNFSNDADYTKTLEDYNMSVEELHSTQGLKMSDVSKSRICHKEYQYCKQQLPMFEHRESDDGESGVGEIEIQASNAKKAWNARTMFQCAGCAQLFSQTSDSEVTCDKRRNLPSPTMERSSCNSSCESDAEQSPCSQYSKSKLSEYEWTGITTNSDDLSYSSESEGGWDDNESLERSFTHAEALDWNIQGSPAAIITSTSNVSDKEHHPTGQLPSTQSPLRKKYLVSEETHRRLCCGPNNSVSCKIFEGADLKKVDLSVLDISSAVISKVDNLQHNTYYLQFGIVMAVVIAVVPSIYRFDYSIGLEFLEGLVTNGPENWFKIILVFSQKLFQGLFGCNIWAKMVIFLCLVNRFCLAGGFFFLLSVAERTFKQRFLYAKHFCYLTSARRARKYDLPHFRLNKVHNIKTWLSVRSCLKKRGPQRSVDVIVSATFFLTLLLVSYLCFELLKEDEKSQHSLYNIELFCWCFPIGIYLIRFTTLGAMINKKYSSLSVLITEQINMYLHMEQKPQKKDELMLANNVLKLVSVLLKELESPFKISGLSANPLLYNITRLVVLSACSGVLSDLLGFKLKLHKIKFED